MASPSWWFRFVLALLLAGFVLHQIANRFAPAKTLVTAAFGS